jgi:hypothetical protein
MQECFAFSPGDSENVMNLDVEGARPVTNAETKLTEQIKIVTTNDKLRSALNNATSNSDNLLAQSFWKASMPDRITVSPIRCDGPAAPDHTNLPLWCSLITRSVSLKSEEAKSAAGQAAIKKELDGLRKRNTWDEANPMELDDLYRDARYPDAMIGRVFGIMGVKSDEIKDSKKTPDMKFRAVFQGNDVRTKSGTSAVELYNEVSNAPASFTASRVVLGCAAVTKMRVSFRDALQAFLQASISGPKRSLHGLNCNANGGQIAGFMMDQNARNLSSNVQSVCYF